MTAVGVARGPTVRGGTIHFSLADPAGALMRVRLLHELHRPRTADFERRSRGGTWTLELPRPDADRLEYQLVLTRRDGSAEVVRDPANPLVAAGPFGEKSVLELPGYRPPGWLGEDAPPGDVEEVEIPLQALQKTLEVRI